MGNKCIVRDCPSLNRKHQVSMFRPPLNPMLLSAWETVMEGKMRCLELTRHSRVCEYHFQAGEVTKGVLKRDQFGNEVYKKYSRPQLKSDAIPSMFDFDIDDTDIDLDIQDENNKNSQNQQHLNESNETTEPCQVSLDIAPSNDSENDVINESQISQIPEEAEIPSNYSAVDRAHTKESKSSEKIESESNNKEIIIINPKDSEKIDTKLKKKEMIINVRICVKKDTSSKESNEKNFSSMEESSPEILGSWSDDESIPLKKAKTKVEDTVKKIPSTCILKAFSSGDTCENTSPKKPVVTNERNKYSRKLDISAFINSSLKLPDKTWAQTSQDEEVFFSKLTVSPYEKRAFIEKQIVVLKNGEVKVYILGKLINLDFGNPTTLVGLRQLMKKVDSLTVCKGGPLVRGNIVYPCAYKDQNSTWRHDNCDIISKTSSCKFCLSLLRSYHQLNV